MTAARAFHSCFEKVYDHGIPFIRPKSGIPYNEVVRRFDARQRDWRLKNAI